MTDIELSVATWNISCGIYDETKKDIDAGINYISTCLKNIAPDIIGLQEVLYSDDFSQASKIAEFAGYNYVYNLQLSPSHLGTGYKMGIALLSKYPILNTNIIKLQNPNLSNVDKSKNSHDKAFISSIITVGSIEIAFITGHMFSFHSFGSTANNFEYIFRELDANIIKIISLNKPSIVCADFNTRNLNSLLSNTTKQCKPIIHITTRKEPRLDDNILCTNHWYDHKTLVFPTFSDHHISYTKMKLSNSIIPDAVNSAIKDISSTKINILHLSDLHFGNGTYDGIDNKANIPFNKNERIELFTQYLTNNKIKIDYVAASGDFTNSGDPSGFIQFNTIVHNLQADNVLPDSNHIIVVPGNHDVNRNDPANLFTNFITHIGGQYPRPWIPQCDVSLTISELTQAINRQLNDNSLDLYGALIKGSGKPICCPFILDMKKEILFYAFNSSSISGTKIEANIDGHAVMIPIDAARIDSQEFLLFSKIINLIKNKCNSHTISFDKLIKVAVLHHHVTPIAVFEEIKMFESLLNAGKFKHLLQKEGFQIILHGHKHWPEAFIDTAIAGGGAHVVISGGTIGSPSAVGKFPGFYIVEITKLSTDANAKISFYEIKDEEAIFSQLENPKVVTMAIPEPTKIGLFKINKGSTTQFLDMNQLYNRTSNAMLKCLREKEPLIGWNHRLGYNKISTVATAYGLRIMNLINSKDTQFINKRNKIINTVYNSRLKTGGWKSSSANTNTSIEATLWITEALKCYHRDDCLETASDDLKKMLSSCSNEIFYHNVYPVTLAINVLSDMPDFKDIVAQLYSIVVSSAVRDRDGNIIYWRQKTNLTTESDNDRNIFESSVLHTAHAMISLITAGNISNVNQVSLVKVNEWLLSQLEWKNTDDIMYIESTSGRDQLKIDHYTKPWVVVALLKAGVDVRHEKIRSSINEICNKQKQNGLWDCGDIVDPIWATYDALNALTEYALRAATCPIVEQS